MKQHDLIDFLVLAAEQGASDLHLTAGSPPMMRIAGVIQPLTEEALSAEDTRRLVVDALKEGQRAKLENDWQLDFALQVDGVGRFRGNACYVSGAIEANFRRIPSDDQRTICEVFGWSDDLASNLRYDQPTILRELAKLDESRLAQFMMLCSFAHYGANQYKHNQVDQKPVVQLSKERGINHTLIDAQVRVELCAKKYKAAHEAYLDAVAKGEAAKKPVVYEQPPQKEKVEAAGKKAPAKTATKAKSVKQKNTARG